MHNQQGWLSSLARTHHELIKKRVIGPHHTRQIKAYNKCKKQHLNLMLPVYPVYEIAARLPPFNRRCSFTQRLVVLLLQSLRFQQMNENTMYFLEKVGWIFLHTVACVACVACATWCAAPVALFSIFAFDIDLSHGDEAVDIPLQQVNRLVESAPCE